MINYYVVLGVPADACAEDIKRAFREMAFRHHPDRNPKDLRAHAMMKQINEAHDVLLNPGKRRQHDADLAKSRRPLPKPKVVGRVQISLKHAFTGGPIKWSHLIVDIPPGVDDGGIAKIRGVPSLAVRVSISSHHEYRRHGSDLFKKIYVPFQRVIYGSIEPLLTLNRDTILVDISPCNTLEEFLNQRRIRLRSQGMPIPNEFGARGDLYVTLHPTYPEVLRDTSLYGPFSLEKYHLVKEVFEMKKMGVNLAGLEKIIELHCDLQRLKVENEKLRGRQSESRSAARELEELRSSIYFLELENEELRNDQAEWRSLAEKLAIQLGII